MVFHMNSNCLVIPGGIGIKIASDSRNSQRNARNCFQTNIFEYFTIDLRLNVKGKHNIQSSKVRHVDSLYVAFKFSVYDYTVSKHNRNTAQLFIILCAENCDFTGECQASGLRKGKRSGICNNI